MLNDIEIGDAADDMPALAGEESPDVDSAPATGGRVRRDLPAMMRKIPVTLTLEVGSARMSLQDLIGIDENSVVELDTLAGEPLVLKVNGTPIGRAQVVVVGDSYGLKVIELSDLDIGSFGR